MSEKRDAANDMAVCEAATAVKWEADVAAPIEWRKYFELAISHLPHWIDRAQQAEAQINNFLTYGQGGASFSESQWIAKIREQEERHVQVIKRMAADKRQLRREVSETAIRLGCERDRAIKELEQAKRNADVFKKLLEQEIVNKAYWQNRAMNNAKELDRIIKQLEQCRGEAAVMQEALEDLAPPDWHPTFTDPDSGGEPCPWCDGYGGTHDHDCKLVKALSVTAGTAHANRVEALEKVAEVAQIVMRWLPKEYPSALALYDALAALDSRGGVRE